MGRKNANCWQTCSVYGASGLVPACLACRYYSTCLPPVNYWSILRHLQELHHKGLWFLCNLWERKKVYAQGLLFVLIINMVSVAFWITNPPPHQYAYFNLLAGPQQFQ